MYSYTAAGRVTKKLLKRTSSGYSLKATYTWDNEGKMTSVAYPVGGPTDTYTFDTVGRPVKLTRRRIRSRLGAHYPA